MHEVVRMVFLLQTNDELQFRCKHFEKAQTRRSYQKYFFYFPQTNYWRNCPINMVQKPMDKLTRFFHG